MKGKIRRKDGVIQSYNFSEKRYNYYKKEGLILDDDQSIKTTIYKGLLHWVQSDKERFKRIKHIPKLLEDKEVNYEGNGIYQLGSTGTHTYKGHSAVKVRYDINQSRLFVVLRGVDYDL